MKSVILNIKNNSKKRKIRKEKFSLFLYVEETGVSKEVFHDLHVQKIKKKRVKESFVKVNTETRR